MGIFHANAVQNMSISEGKLQETKMKARHLKSENK